MISQTAGRTPGSAPDENGYGTEPRLSFESDERSRRRRVIDVAAKHFARFVEGGEAHAVGMAGQHHVHVEHDVHRRSLLREGPQDVFDAIGIHAGRGFTGQPETTARSVAWTVTDQRERADIPLVSGLALMPPN